MDKELQLLRELNSNEISITQIRDALIKYMRQREDLPSGVKGLLCNSRTGGTKGLIFSAFDPILEILKIVEKNKESK